MIPPGGEGEIKVTLRTGSARRHIKKTVRVVSNDPENPTSYIHVEATIKVDTGQEDFSLNLDNILSSKRTTHNVYLRVDKDKEIEISEVISSSEFVRARLVPPADSTERSDSVEIEIAVEPGLEPGLLSEKITVHFKDDARARAYFYLYGIVVADIEVAPLRLTYIVTDSILDIRNQTRKLMVFNYREDLPLEIVGANVPGDHLDLTVNTIEEGSRFEITAVANEKVLVVDSTLNNRIIITTNNPEMRRIKVPFQVLRR